MSIRSSGAGVRRDSVGIGDRWNVAAILCAILFSAAIVLLPLVAETSETVESSGAVATTPTRRSLVETEGAGVVVAALIPALIAAAPMFGRTQRFRHRARLGASAVLGVAAILGAASIGVFLTPTLILMMVAASRTDAAPNFTTAPAAPS